MIYNFNMAYSILINIQKGTSNISDLAQIIANIIKNTTGQSVTITINDNYGRKVDAMNRRSNG